MRVCTCGWCDANEARDHALYGAEHGGLAKVESVKQNPHHDASSSTHVCVKDGQRRHHAHRKRTSTVEPTPTHPQQACACKPYYHVV